LALSQCLKLHPDPTNIPNLRFQIQLYLFVR